MPRRQDAGSIPATSIMGEINPALADTTARVPFIAEERIPLGAPLRYGNRAGHCRVYRGTGRFLGVAASMPANRGLLARLFARWRRPYIRRGHTVMVSGSGMIYVENTGLRAAPAGAAVCADARGRLRAAPGYLVPGAAWMQNVQAGDTGVVRLGGFDA